MAIGTLFTGARARITLKGKKIGYATNVTASETVQYQDAVVLDSIEKKGHEPVGYDVRWSASTLRMLTDTLTSLGIMAGKGKSAQEHLTNLIALGEASMIIEDSQTGRAIGTLTGVVVSDRNLSVQARSIAGEDISGTAIRFVDEGDASAA